MSWPSSRSSPNATWPPPRPAACSPTTLPLADVVFNLGRMGLLVAGLADPDALVPEATDDRIHQPARTTLFPEAPELLRALVDAGALAASWSGAGPTLLGVVRGATADAVLAGAEEALAKAQVPGRALVLQADRTGIVYGDEAEVPL